MSQSFRERILI